MRENHTEHTLRSATRAQCSPFPIKLMAIVVIVAVTLAAFGFLPEAGDTTRPPEAEGHAYVDLDHNRLDVGDKALVKLNDTWYWANRTSGELEYIGDDPE